MKQLLLMGTTLLSIATYISDINSAYGSTLATSPKEMTPEALHKRWNEKIVPALSNQEISLKTFKDLIAPLTEFLHSSSSRHHISARLLLGLSVLNTTLINALNKISNDLTSIEAMLDKNTDSEISEIIENNPEIKNDLVMNKLFLLPYNNIYHLYETISSEEATAISQSLINLASCISQLKKPLRDWLIKNNIHYFLQNTAYFFANFWVYNQDGSRATIGSIPFHLKDITKSPLYSEKDGFNSLAIAILAPYYKMNQISEFLLEEPNSKPNPKIVSDFVRGVINYTKILQPTDIKYIIKSLKDYFHLTTASHGKESAIDIIDSKQQDPTLSKESVRTLDNIKYIIKSLGREADLTKASLCSFNGKESVIDMIDTKQQDPTLSEESKEVLKVIQRVILENMIYTSDFQEAIKDDTSDKLSQKILQLVNKLLEYNVSYDDYPNILNNFKELLRAIKDDTSDKLSQEILQLVNKLLEYNVSYDDYPNILNNFKELLRAVKDDTPDEISQKILKDFNKSLGHDASYEEYQTILKKFEELKTILKKFKELKEKFKELKDDTPDKIAQKILKDFKELLRNAKPDHVKIAIDSVLKWSYKKSNGYVSDPNKFHAKLTRLKGWRDALIGKNNEDQEEMWLYYQQDITKLKRLKMLYEIFSAYKDRINQKIKLLNYSSKLNKVLSERFRLSDDA